MSEYVTTWNQRRNFLLKVLQRIQEETRYSNERAHRAAYLFYAWLCCDSGGYHADIRYSWGKVERIYDNFAKWVGVAPGTTSRAAYLKPAEEFSEPDDDSPHAVMKWGKFLAYAVRKYALNLSEDEVAALAELLGNSTPFSTDFSFAIVRGKEVVRAYEDGPESCMAKEGTAKEYVNWYAENPDTVALLRIEQGGALLGRALVWNAKDAAGNEVVLLDRVYPSDGGVHTTLARHWAREQGWVVKEYDSISAPFEGGGVYSVRMKLRKGNKRYPYMDSFAYARLEKGELHLSNRYSSNAYTLQSTSGAEIPVCYCGCGVAVRRDDMICLVHADQSETLCCQGCIPTDYAYIDGWCYAPELVVQAQTTNGVRQRLRVYCHYSDVEGQWLDFQGGNTYPHATLGWVSRNRVRRLNDGTVLHDSEAGYFDVIPMRGLWATHEQARDAMRSLLAEGYDRDTVITALFPADYRSFASTLLDQPTLLAEHGQGAAAHD